MMPREIPDAEPGVKMSANQPGIAAPPGAELDAIATEGAAAEGLADVAPISSAPPSSSPDADAAAVWALIPQTFGSVLAMAMPELKSVYTAEACNAWGTAMLPVARKYGWHLGPDSPELALLAASVPLALGTLTAIQKRKAAAPARSTAPGAPSSGPRRPANVIDLAAQASPIAPTSPPDLSAQPPA